VHLYPFLLMTQPGADQGGANPISTIILFGSIIAIFYFMIIRPQQKRAKERQTMLDAVKKGDKIVTSGGIYGTVAGMDDKTLLIEIADNVKVKVDKSAVGAVLTESKPEKK
jgi:preprotein translocase subunit YajC